MEKIRLDGLCLMVYAWWFMLDGLCSEGLALCPSPHQHPFIITKLIL
jgi:hypothetical protein